MADEPKIRFIDNPHAPDLYASDAAGFFVYHNNIVVTLESLRPDHATAPGDLNRVVVARLVLPVPAAQSLAMGLFDFLKQRDLLPEDQNPSKAQ